MRVPETSSTNDGTAADAGGMSLLGHDLRAAVSDIIGGLRLIDRNEADDKIIAVMQDDALYGQWHDIFNCPASVIDRLKHYFLTYKDVPGAAKKRVEITHVYGRDEAHQVIALCSEDYTAAFPRPSPDAAVIPPAR